jgi:hypothetical protein
LKSLGEFLTTSGDFLASFLQVFDEFWRVLSSFLQVFGVFGEF